MTMPLWVTETAELFWAMVGEQEDPPRDLRVSIAKALPLSIALLPRLRVSTIDAWLRRRGIMCAISVDDLSLRGCLIARYGHGIVFLEGQDSDDEQRFSLAHELAHFLRHYWLPRQHVVTRLGPAVLEVLDGDRPPTPEERVHALLARVRVGYFIHLMSRSRDSWPDRATTSAAELEADLLAFELLAPSREVIRAISDVPNGDRRSVAAHHLRTKYGLPGKPAERYADILCPGPSGGYSLLHRLGLKVVELSHSGAEEKMEVTDGGE